MKIIKSIILASILALSLYSYTHAASGDLSGTATSATIGDINMSGANFNTANGVGSNTSVTTRPSSVSIGQISFGNEIVGDCPILKSGDTPTSCAPSAVWTNDTNGNIIGGNLKGFVRACSVFNTGCSGALKLDANGRDIYRGGWDGFISLGDGINSTWGVKVTNVCTGTTTRTCNLSGKAWGSDLVGWVDFSNVKISLPAIGALTVGATASPAGLILPASSSTLTGTVSGGTAPVSVAWTVFSKSPTTLPNPTITNPISLVTTVTGMSVAGTYTFRITATDSTSPTKKTATADVSVTVTGANIPPTADAGQDLDAISPATTIALSGTVRDTDGTVSGQWLSGTTNLTTTCGTANASGVKTCTATGTGLTATAKTFTLRATDDKGATARDTMTAKVVTGTFITATNCIIQLNQSNCLSRVRWSDLTGGYPVYVYMGVGSFSSLPSSPNPPGYEDVDMRYGDNDAKILSYKNGWQRVAITTATASCASGLQWNGDYCVDSLPACNLTDRNARQYISNNICQTCSTAMYFYFSGDINNSCRNYNTCSAPWTLNTSNNTCVCNPPNVRTGNFWTGYICTNPSNRLPTVNAGPDQVVTYPADFKSGGFGGSYTGSLSGSGSDVDGDTVIPSWSTRHDTPGDRSAVGSSVSPSNVWSPSYTISYIISRSYPFILPGSTFIFTLTGSDGRGGTANDEMTVYVCANNQVVSNGQCVTECPAGQFISRGICVDQPPVVCTGGLVYSPSTDNCIDCPAGKTSKDGLICVDKSKPVIKEF